MRRLFYIIPLMVVFYFNSYGDLQSQVLDRKVDRTETKRSISKSIINSKLKNLVQSFKSTGRISDLPSHFNVIQKGGLPTIRIEIRTNESNNHRLVKDLSKLNATNIEMYKNIINATIPIDEIDQLESRSDIKYVDVPWAIRRTGSVTGQHLQAHGIDNLQGSPANLTGLGVKVGVMSDSYDCLGGASGDVSSGDVPSVVNLEEIGNCAGATDEGRALAQLVYDGAPGSSIYHHTAFNGMASFATGIGELVSAGCNIIVDDVLYFAETWYQDDIVAQAVDAADAAGVLFFSAAGNSKNGGYEHPSPGSVTEDVNQWLIFNGSDNSLNINVPAGSTVIATLQWDDPIQNIDTDLDMYLYRVGEVFSVESSTEINVNSETILWENSGSTSEDMEILVDHFGGPLPGRFKIVIWNSDVTITDNYSGVGTSTILGHSNAAGAIAVGAANYWETPGFGTDPVQIWDGCPSSVCSVGSSQGGQLIVFDGNGGTLRLAPIDRMKPDMIAAHGVNTTFFGSDIAMDSDAHPNFFGTSASAPVAGGIAALLVEANNDLSFPLTYPQVLNCILNNTNNGFFDAEASAQCIDANILPVVLSSFSVREGDCYNTLNWSASSERNFSHYEVEKSIDGKNFKTIASIPSHGDLRSSGYEYTDKLPSHKTYYRLKMVDLDATFAYSEIVFSQSNCNSENQVLHLPYNIITKTNGILNYEISPQAQLDKIFISDVSGKIIMTINPSQTDLSGTVDVSRLNSGLYYISVRDIFYGRVTKEFILH
jgi:hypothetical protein